MTRIIVIEDQVHQLNFLVKILRSEGYEVLGTDNGLDGIRLIEQSQPDLVLCDITMPGVDGYGVLVTMRSTPETALIPFMFLTGHSAREELRHGMELGADDYITKPVSRAELVAAIKTRLEKHAALQREYEAQIEQLRGEISIMLPHELRTPLMGIMGFSELLITDCETMTPQQIRQFAENIMVSCRRLNRLVENYLLFAQIEILKGDPERILDLQRQAIFEPGLIISEVAHERAAYYERPADLHLHVQDTILNISKEAVRKIAEELIDNAFKFSSVNTPVHITAGLDDGIYCLCVQDRGRGMTPEQIASIGAYVQFERRLYEQQGSGLGLVIARRLAEMYGGRLTLESASASGTKACAEIPPGT